jgi:hypothetical protein
MKTCGKCKHWVFDDEPGWPDCGTCCCPLPGPLVDREENVAGWQLYIDRNDKQAEDCACFKPGRKK